MWCAIFPELIFTQNFFLLWMETFFTLPLHLRVVIEGM